MPLGLVDVGLGHGSDAYRRLIPQRLRTFSVPLLVELRHESLHAFPVCSKV